MSKLEQIVNPLIKAAEGGAEKERERIVNIISRMIAVEDELPYKQQMTGRAALKALKQEILK